MDPFRYTLVFDVDDEKIKRTIPKEIIEKHSKSWCLLVMLADLIISDESPTAVLMDNNEYKNNEGYLNKIIECAEDIISLEDYDTIIKCLDLCLYDSNYWKLTFPEMRLLLQQGIITSRALISLSEIVDRNLQSDDQQESVQDQKAHMFLCDISEFELSNQIRNIEFNNIHQYWKAYKYLCACQYNPKVLSYQIICYNWHTTIININCVPVQIRHMNGNSTFQSTQNKLRSTLTLYDASYEERLSVINLTNIYGVENITFYIDKLFPSNNLDDIESHNFTDYDACKIITERPCGISSDTEHIIRKYPKTGKLIDSNLWIGQHNRFMRGSRSRAYLKSYKSVKFQFNCDKYPTMLDRDTLDKALVIIDNIMTDMEDINPQNTATLLIDCESETMIEIHCGYLMIQ